MKKIIAVLIVIAMSFVLYACGSSSTNISTSSKNSIPQELLEKLKANSHTPVDAVISFRSFQWFEKLNDVKKFINENNDPDIGNVSDIGDILNVDHYILPAIIEDKQIITFDDVKDDYRIYPNVKGKKISITKRTDVAGYPATITMYFLYPIIDGKIIENDDYSEFEIPEIIGVCR